MRVLIAEDELPLNRAIAKILEKNNISADSVYNGDEALNFLRSDNYDAVILDIMMPILDGIAVLKRARAEGINVPVIILSARSEVEDKVLGLDSGANDYLAKPFDSRELLARLRALTRPKASPDTKLSYGNTTLDRATFELSTPFGCIKLANKEYQILETLMKNPSHVNSSERLMEKIWGFDSEAELNVVWVYISYLRKKLASIKSNVRIRASRNAGYCLEVR